MKKNKVKLRVIRWIECGLLKRVKTQQVCNPLGSKRNKHKLCAIYYTVGNMGTKYCSQLKHIHLALLVRYCHVKQFGLDEILKPLIDDLKKLSSKGINVLVDGSEKKKYLCSSYIC